MHIPTQRRYIGALILLLFFGDKMPSILDPSPSMASQIVEQYSTPQEDQDAVLAAREEDRLVRSAARPVSKDVLDWIQANYVDPGDVPQTPSRHAVGSRGLPTDLPGSDLAVLSGQHRPIAPTQRAEDIDITPAFGSDDEFENVLAMVGRRQQTFESSPFAERPELPGLSRPSGRAPRGERGRAAGVRQWDPIFERASRETGVDANYLRAMARAESSGDPNALSPAGAAGVMQFIPSTARQYGLRVDNEVDERTDPTKAIPAAARYFADLLERYNGNHDLAVAAYNAGPGAVDKHKGIPPFAETRNHVRVVRGYYDNFRTGKY